MRIADASPGAHHAVMQNSSRGNTVVAALLLVTLVGAGALTFDSVQSQAIQSQLAQVPASTGAAVSSDRGACIEFNGRQICEKDASRQKCEIGHDYIIKMVSGVDEKTKASIKVSVVLPTKNDLQPILSGETNQCVLNKVGFNSVPGRNAIPTRQCTTAWKCYVTFCKPKGFTGDALKQEECIFINKPISVGAEIDKEKLADEHLSSQLTQTITDKNASAEQKLEAIKYLPTLSTPVADGVSKVLASEANNATSAMENQAAIVEAAQKQRDDALWILAACKERTSNGSCEAENIALSDAQRDLANRNKSLDEMRKYSESLKTTQKTLESSVVTPPKRTDCLDARDCAAGVYYTPPKSTFEQNINCPGGAGCPRGTWDPNKGRLVTTGEGDRTAGGGSGGLGNIANLLKPLLGLAQSALGITQGGAPTCKLTASPTNITQAGQSVTLSWTSQGAQQAQLSNVGNVGPSGSMQVQPQQTTTYTLQVAGTAQNTQQQQQQESFCITNYNPVTVMQFAARPGCLNYNPSIAQPAAAQYQYSNCQVQVTVGAQNSITTPTPASEKPVAQISCQPKIVDVDMQATLSFACQNASVSSGSGFSTQGALSGSATTTIFAPTLGSNTQTFGLTCSKDGVIDSAQCTVQVNKSAIVLVANPKTVKNGETSNIGWVTGGMESCVISSPTHAQFTTQNVGISTVSGVAKSPSLIGNAEFVLNCVTKGGGTKSARVTVELE